MKRPETVMMTMDPEAPGRIVVNYQGRQLARVSLVTLSAELAGRLTGADPAMIAAWVRSLDLAARELERALHQPNAAENDASWSSVLR